MSLTRDILKDTVGVRQAWTGETVVNDITGARFMAEVQEITDIELNESFGRDPRESVLLHVLDRVSAAGLNMNQTVTVSLYGADQKFYVVRRSDNPSSATVEFGLAKITSKDQT